MVRIFIWIVVLFVSVLVGYFGTVIAARICEGLFDWSIDSFARVFLVINPIISIPLGLGLFYYFEKTATKLVAMGITFLILAVSIVLIDIILGLVLGYF